MTTLSAERTEHCTTYLTDRDCPFDHGPSEAWVEPDPTFKCDHDRYRVSARRVFCPTCRLVGMKQGDGRVKWVVLA